MPRYWIYEDDEVKGPFPPEDIKQRDDYTDLLYCEEDADDWKPAHEIPELAPEDDVSVDPVESTTNDAGQLIEGTRRNVTVLFADLSGFTRLTEELGDEEMHRLTNDVFDRLVPSVKEHGGEIDKYIGDEIMALFGAEKTHEDDPERAVMSALDMIEELDKYNKTNDMDLSIHIGINTGKVVAADIGGRLQSQFSVTGSGVDIAVGLTAEAEDNSIFVGPATQKRLRGRFKLRPVPDIELKRLDKEINAFEVRGRKSTDEAIEEETTSDRQSDQTKGQTMSFVNREQELESLRKIVRDDADPSAALISGPGGVGKTRLVAHFLAHEIPEDMENLTLQGDPYSERLPYSTSLSMFDRALGLTTSDNRPRTEDELAEHIPRENKVYDALSLVYGIGGDETGGGTRENLDDVGRGSSVPERNLREASEQIILELSQFLRRALSEGQIILTVDDAQWADPRSISLLSTMIKQQSRSEPAIPIIMDSRPSGIENDPEALREIGDEATRTNMFVEEGITESTAEGPPLGEILELDEALIHLNLSPLSPDIIRRIIEETYPDVTIPEGFVKSVEDRTGGLAIHIEQVLRSLQDQGHIYQENEQWIIDEEARDVPMPETLHDLIVSRVDQLDEVARDVLLISSVLGVNFESWLIESVTDQSREELERSIDHLLDRGFLRTREDEYIFQHGTIQEVTYDLLLEEDRETFHSRAAEQLRARLNLENPVSRDRVATHYRGAKQWEELFKLRIEGIEQALGNYSLDDADRIAADILEYDWEKELDSHWSARFLYALGRLRMHQFDLDEARDYLKKSLELLDDSGDLRSLAMKHGTLGSIHEKMDELDKAQSQHEKALELDREANNRKGVGMRLGALGRIELKRNNYNEAFELTNEAMKIDRQLNDRKGEAIRLSTLGQIEKKQGRFREARDYFEQSLEIERAIDNTRGQSIMLGQLGNVTEELENLREAKIYYEEAVELDREMGNDYGVSFHLGSLGRVAEKLDQLNEAEEYISRAREVNKELGNDSARAYQLGILARISKKKAEYGQAEQYLTEALKLNRSQNDIRGQAIHRTTRAEVHEQSGNFGEALEDYREALELNDELGNKPGLAIVHTSLGKLMESLGKWTSARDHHERGLEINREMDNDEGKAIGLAGLGRLEEEQQNYRKAEELTRDALALNQSIDNPQGQALQEVALARIFVHQEKLQQANDSIENAIERAKEADETSVHFSALRVDALREAKTGNLNSAVKVLRKAGSLYSQSLDWLTRNPNLDKIPDSLSGTSLSIAIALALCNKLNADNESALELINRLLTIFPTPPESPDQLQRLKEALLLKVRLDGTQFDEPWNLMREHLGNDELIDEEQATNTPSDSTGWLDTTMDSVTDWLSGEDTDEQVNWEMVDPNFKTTVKDSDQHGESLLVLVNLDEAEVEKVRNELSVPTSSPFSSDYDTRYQYGFFITNPSDRAVTELKGVLNDYI